MHTGRVLRSFLLLVLSAFLIAGCGVFSGGESDAQSAATPDPQPSPTEQISLADLGIDDWPAVTRQQIPEPPSRPVGVDQREYDDMVAAIGAWALQAASRPDTVGEGLPPALADSLDEAFAAQTAPALARGSVLEPGLEVLDSRMTAAWDVTEVEDETRVSLQTRTAYEVRAEGGPVRVIGVLRTQGLIAVPEAQGWGTILGWQEFGAADCAIALDGFLTPGGDTDDQQHDLTIFAEIGSAPEAVSPALQEEDNIDEDFKRACAAGRV